jgi:hypothetical protein
MSPVSDKVSVSTISGYDVRQLIIPSSFVAKVTSTAIGPDPGNVLTEFDLAAGAWVVQAKATVAAEGGKFDPELPNFEGGIGLTLNLQCPADSNSNDRSTVDSSGHPVTIIVISGFHLSAPSVVSLVADNLSNNLATAVLSNIVISATKEEDLITLEL